MAEPKTLSEYIVPLRERVKKDGDLSFIPDFIEGLARVDKSFPRLARQQLGRIIFNHHPGFVALGGGLSRWPQGEREAFAAKIADSARDVRRLEGAVHGALLSAKAAVEEHNRG